MENEHFISRNPYIFVSHQSKFLQKGGEKDGRGSKHNYGSQRLLPIHHDIRHRVCYETEESNPRDQRLVDFLIRKVNYLPWHSFP